ncbi:Sec-independent protein translocase protein TatB [Bombella sp. TMW 2.2543]|uniref:Sec-independent protein translocase protein TatB n=1 Tax=Bombella pluederhausensis TaxID=2967336 RepID=A0ABT3WKG7_9PROT|nr:Sec-independent protein translocase protein TatB [Bombella pluederhausensis]MCX5617336.1 Sec-independent protein translocase protein TatB [Bombella pluederhausensis]
MFDLSWTEIALLVVVALVCIGPKDLPVAMRTLSKAIKAIRRMGAEFQHHLDEMVKEADLSEARDHLREIRQFSPREQLRKAIDPDRSMEKQMEFGRQEGMPVAPPPPPPPPPPAPGSEELNRPRSYAQPHNARMQAQAEALERAPALLPPTTALRLIEEARYWHRPAFLPPEIALHNGRRAAILSAAPSSESMKGEPQHGSA